MDPELIVSEAADTLLELYAGMSAVAVIGLIALSLVWLIYQILKMGQGRRRK